MIGIRLSKYIFSIFRGWFGHEILGVEQFESIFPDWTAVRDRHSDVWLRPCLARSSPVSDDRYRVI